MQEPAVQEPAVQEPPVQEPAAQPLGVGMVGYAFMGAAHAQAWRTAAAAFELPLRPRLAAICGRDAAAVCAAAGWAGRPRKPTGGP